MIADRANGNMYEVESTSTVESVGGFSESLYEILWRRRWIVLAAVVLSLGGGFFYLQRATPLYTSTSRIYVEQEGPQLFERDASGVVARWSNYLYTQAELIQRAETLSKALALPAMGRPRTFAHVSNPVAALRKGLEVVVGKKDEIINVSFTSPYREEAANIVNLVVEVYITSHNERKRNTSGEVVEILREEKTKRDRELGEKLQQMAQYEMEHESLVFGTDRGDNVVVRNLERFQLALAQAQLATIESRTFYEIIKNLADDPLRLRQYVEAQSGRGTSAAAGSDAARLRMELQDLDRQRADCLGRVTLKAPAIPALDAEIERIQRQLATLDKQFAEGQLAIAEEQFHAAQAKEKELGTHFEAQRQEAVSLNNRLTQYALLQSDYQRTKEFCDILDDRIRKLNVDPQVGSLNIEIVETASPATFPSSPQKARTMGLALCLGLFGGVALALLREWKDQRLRSTEEISALLGLPVLGAVPVMARAKLAQAGRGHRAQTNGDSHEAEAFRTIRTAVFFGAPKDETRTILITSPAPGEGKSTVTANLGMAMAQAGQRVAIVDADFRRPMQHRLFDLDNRAKGLSSILAGQMSLEEAVQRVDVDKLDILTCGPAVSNPAEMINSESFTQLIRTLAATYDRVIVDSPPVVAVTDALILAAQSDVTILVLRAQTSTRRVSARARDGLAGVNARILGVIVNGVPRKGSHYGYYGGYGYYGHDRRNGGNGHSQEQPVAERKDGRSKPPIPIREHDDRPREDATSRVVRTSGTRAGPLQEARHSSGVHLPDAR